MANVAALDAQTRYENIDRAVKATALLEYKMRTLCTIDSSAAWTESYFQRVNTVEAAGGGTGSSVSGVPQMSPFPYIEQPFVKVSAVVKKYAAESILSVENLSSATIPMLKEAVQTISRTVAYALDVAIEAVLSASAGQSYAITAGNEWDSATVANRDPVYDLLAAIQKLRAVGIDALNGNGYIVLNGTDYTRLISNSKVMNNPSFKTADVVSNGVVGQIAGLKIMLSEAVTADQAYLVVGQTALTLKEADPLQTSLIEDPGKSTTIRAWLRAAIQIPVPNAVCKITNTRA